MTIQGSTYVSVLQESENIVPSDEGRVYEGLVCESGLRQGLLGGRCAQCLQTVE